MPDVSDRLLNELLQLPFYSRAALVDALVDSLNRPPSPETESRWEAEIASELDELERAA